MSLSIAAVTRFSVVNFQSMLSFRAGKAAVGADDLRRVIFDSRRLEARWRLFTALTLPSLDVMSVRHDSFFSVLLVSPELPAALRAGLKELTATRPWLLIRDVQFEDGLGEISEAAFSQVDMKDRIFAFRIDDDDALSADAIGVMKRLEPTSDDGSILSFDRGFYMRSLSVGRFVIGERYFKNIALGLGVFSSRHRPISPFRLGNHKALKGTVINVDDRPYWLRLVHSSNDSAASVGRPWSIGVSRQRASKQLSPYFPGLNISENLSAI